MAPDVSSKLQQILQGKLKYTSANLGLNMLISRLQRKVADDPGCMAACIKEIDDFAIKYPTVVSADFSKIAAL
ncbi:MAG: hypothetical protein IJU59_05495 [Firmicutes bacterium]|nr:hypothetical protein [Bacillota bacterium]